MVIPGRELRTIMKLTVMVEEASSAEIWFSHLLLRAEFNFLCSPLLPASLLFSFIPPAISTGEMTIQVNKYICSP